MAGACSERTPAPSTPSAFELYLAGRFTEALAQAPPDLAARIHYDDNGPSLLDRAPPRDAPHASPLTRLEAQCKAGRCDFSAILAYRDQHKSELSTLIRTGRLLLPANTQAAGDCVEAALPLAQPLRAKQDIVSLHWTTATDELYADVLAKNRHLGHARGLYQKALAALRYFPAQSAYTERRAAEIAAKVSALDRALFAK